MAPPFKSRSDKPVNLKNTDKNYKFIIERLMNHLSNNQVHSVKKRDNLLELNLPKINFWVNKFVEKPSIWTRIKCQAMSEPYPKTLEIYVGSVTFWGEYHINNSGPAFRTTTFEYDFKTLDAKKLYVLAQKAYDRLQDNNLKIAIQGSANQRPLDFED